MKTPHDGYEAYPFPRIRLPMVDGGRMGRQKHTVHGLVEVDVTEARQAILKHKSQTGEALSFTAFIMTCVGQAVDKNKRMHAYKNWRNQMIVFDEVDANTLFEVEVDGRKLIQTHIIRGINKKTFLDIHSEIRAFQVEHGSSRESKFFRWFVLLPGFLRRIFYWVLFKNSHLLKEYFGTVSVTAVGMFGTGGFWGIPVPNHTLQITLGGIAEKPGVVGGRIEIREYLSLTISFDHDIVDGAPAARFAQRLKELIENGYGLREVVEAPEQSIANDL
jgi:pyruvate/2-oxoglutarate dehydrogenase complex dihydrolipoamide acyltransferase (E2) component